MNLLPQYLLAYPLLPILKVITTEVKEAVIGVASLAGDGMVDGFDIDMSLQMQILLAELPQEDIGAVFGSGEEESDCAYLCLWDWVFGNYFNFAQLQKRVVGSSGDEETCDMHFSTVTVIGLDDVALRIISRGCCDDKTLRANQLSHLCPLSQ